MAKKDDFSFKKAVAEACRDFPEETKNIVFIDMTAPDARERFARWVDSQHGDNKLQFSRENQIEDYFDTLYFKHGFAAMHGTDGGKDLMVFSGNNTNNNHLFSNQFIFDHELGHLIVKGGKSKRPDEQMAMGNPEYVMAAIARAECAADSFAALRGLKRGNMTIDDMMQLSVSRAAVGWRAGNLGHTTTTAIDALLTSHPPSLLWSLSPQQQKDYAAEAAAEHAPGPRGINNIVTFLKGLQKTGGVSTEERIAKLADIVMEMPAGSLAFHIAGRLLGEAFKTGVIDFVGPLTDFAPKEKWLDAARTLKSRASGQFAELMRDFDENKLDAMLSEMRAPKQKPHPAFNVLEKLKTPVA